jgi:hypothetical protein
MEAWRLMAGVIHLLLSVVIGRNPPRIGSFGEISLTKIGRLSL